MTARHPWTSMLKLAALGALLLAPAGAKAQMLDPAQPQPDPDQLKPGLEVCYMYELVRHIDEMVGFEELARVRAGRAAARAERHRRPGHGAEQQGQ